MKARAVIASPGGGFRVAKILAANAAAGGEIIRRPAAQPPLKAPASRAKIVAARQLPPFNCAG
jgi:hypothetical protein